MLVFEKGPYINREGASELFGALVTTQLSENFAEFSKFWVGNRLPRFFFGYFFSPHFFLVGVGNDGSPIL